MYARVCVRLTAVYFILDEGSDPGVIRFANKSACVPPLDFIVAVIPLCFVRFYHQADLIYFAARSRSSAGVPRFKIAVAGAAIYPSGNF